MKAKNIFLKLVAVVFLGAFSLKAEIPVTQIRGLASVLKPDKQYLSPVWGAVLWNSPYVENLYRFGLPTSNTVKLARSIFFVHHDDVTFDTTYLATRIATYFTPYFIGQLVALIDNYQINTQKLAELKTKLTEKRKIVRDANTSLSGKQISGLLAQQEPVLSKQIKDLFGYKKKTLQEFKNVINTFELENKDRIQEKIKTYFEEKYIPKLEADLGKDPENQVLQQLLQKAKDNKDLGIENSTYKQYKDEFLNFLVKSLNETNLFIPNNTIFLFLSSLWKKTNDKNEFLAYFKGLKDKHDNKEDLFNNSQFIANGFPEDSFEYTEENYKIFKEASEAEVKTKYINDLEALAFLHLGYDLFDNPLPSEVGMLDGVEYKEFSFPDCGGTSLLNFFNVILYNQQTREFDLKHLNGFRLNPKLTAFYTKYKKATKIRTRQVHDDWAVVTSELEGVLYSAGGVCEITPGLKNMLKVIDNLVGTKTFEELADKLKANGIEVEIDYGSDSEDELDEEGEIYFNITKPGTNDFSIEWMFDENHFQLAFPSEEKLFSKNYVNVLKSFEDANDYNTEKQIIFLDLFSDVFIKKIQHINFKISKNLLNQYEYFTFLIQNIYAPERKIKLLEELIEHKILHKNQKLYIEFARSIYTQIPEDDAFGQRRYFKILCKSDLKIFDPTKNPFNKLTDRQKNYAIYSFLRNSKDKNLISWINKILPTIEDDFYKIQIIKEILCNSKDKDLMKWAKDTIFTIEGDRYRWQIAHTIILGRDEDKDLMEWAKETIFDLKEDLKKTGDTSKGRVVRYILYFYRQYRDSKYTDLMKWVKSVLPTIKDSEVRKDIIVEILKYSKDEDLIEWVKENIPTINIIWGKDSIINAILYKPIQQISNLRQFLEVVKTAKRKFAGYLAKKQSLKEGLNQKIQEIEAEIQRRETQEDASVTLGFMSKIKQFWNKLTFRKQSKTIIKTA
jgi:hypothetical protein